jgi:hypothetical protein
MSTHDDPGAHATARLGQAVAVLAAAAEAFAQLGQVRAAARATRDERAAAAARAQLRARHGADRLAWSPLLDERAATLPVPDALAGWGAARCWPDDPEAQAARRAAEQRLGELRPEAMRVYGEQVAAGGDPGTAMRDAGWLLDREPARFTPEPAAGCPALSGAGRDGGDGADLEPRRAGVVDQSRTVDGVVIASRAEPLARQCFPGPLVVDVAAAALLVAPEGAGQAVAANLTPTRPLTR